MGQQLITAALDVNKGQYLSSVKYGWRQEEGGGPELDKITPTIGGVPEEFLSAAEQWNNQSIGKGKNKEKNLELPGKNGWPEGMPGPSSSKGPPGNDGNGKGKENPPRKGPPGNDGNGKGKARAFC